MLRSELEQFLLYLSLRGRSSMYENYKKIIFLEFVYIFKLNLILAKYTCLNVFPTKTNSFKKYDFGKSAKYSFIRVMTSSLGMKRK